MPTEATHPGAATPEAPARLARPPSVPAARAPAPRRGGRWRAVLGLGALPPLAALLGFLWFLDAAAAPPEAPDRPTDGIVVLTGGAERVRTGLALLAAGKAERLLVSGAHPDARLAELAQAAGQPVAPLHSRVALGRAARSTRGNAAETAAWARAEGLRSIRVVTAGYHMPRATLELRRALPAEVALVPHPVMPPALRDAAAPARPRTWSLLAGEYAKLIGALLGLAPAPEGIAP